ncbi:MAG: MarR family transcriptional regulator [Anaerolineales bacterium]|nr:MAG: MarR family transcriptional regulator [Anaerolineales bacterium]
MPTHYDGTPEETNALNAFIKLTRAADTLSAHLTQRKSMGNLTIRQFGVLESLYHLGPLRQGEISVKLLKSGGNITLVVDNLEKSGLVLRTRDTEDRRAVTVSLTEQGRELIAGLFPRHVANIVREFSILTQAEQRQLGELCRILGKQERTIKST